MKETPSLHTDTVVVLETNIDDISPQIFEIVEEHLFAAGALDVWIEHIQMKKNRPGFKLCCITAPDRSKDLAAIIMEETTSIGVRFYEVERYILSRKEQVVTTKYGDVAVKIVTLPSGKERIMPEYESCRSLANKNGIPFITMYRSIIASLMTEGSGQ